MPSRFTYEHVAFLMRKFNKKEMTGEHMRAFLLDHAAVILSIEVGLIIGLLFGMVGTVLYIRLKRR